MPRKSKVRNKRKVTKGLIPRAAGVIRKGSKRVKLVSEGVKVNPTRGGRSRKVRGFKVKLFEW